jgi:hypothetical protein
MLISGTPREIFNDRQFLRVLGAEAMASDDFFRARLDGMVDPRHPLAVLAHKMPWTEIEAALAPAFTHKDRKGCSVEGADMFGLGEAGVQQLLRTTIETAVAIHAVKKTEFERLIVDTTVQEKAIAHPTDARLLDVARQIVVRYAQRAGIALQMTYERKGKARKPYEFGVKASIVVTHGKGLMVGARTFPGNPYDGHTLVAQIEQTTTLLDNIGTKPTTAMVDLGYRGVDDDVATVNVIHRGKAKTLTARQKT